MFINKHYNKNLEKKQIHNIPLRLTDMKNPTQFGAEKVSVYKDCYFFSYNTLILTRTNDHD